MTDTPIESFSGQYRFLSNFWTCRVEVEGRIYSSVEHAYQAAKALTSEDHDRIANAATAALAKRLGQQVLMRPDFETIKLDVMRDCLRSKFSNPTLRHYLLATGDRPLVEGNHWGDHFWGVCKGSGENWLGRLLMEIRAECRG